VAQPQLVIELAFRFQFLCHFLMIEWHRRDLMAVDCCGRSSFEMKAVDEFWKLGFS
jgi:hypothetical protein